MLRDSRAPCEAPGSLQNVCVAPTRAREAAYEARRMRQGGPRIPACLCQSHLHHRDLRSPHDTLVRFPITKSSVKLCCYNTSARR